MPERKLLKELLKLDALPPRFLVEDVGMDRTAKIYVERAAQRE